MSQLQLAPAPAAASPTPAGVRTDIQALRALAVATVVGFHLWPGRLPGGYVGVDVFFVISGFLIGSHLLRELQETGRIRLAAFWARRAKRLLPASLTVLMTTAVAVLLVSPQAVQRDFLSKIAAATLYVENWALAKDAVDYQASDAATTPVQHFWSLSAEEQFYVALPLLLLLAALLARPVPRARPLVVGSVVAGLMVGSFAFAVRAVQDSPQQAYFSTATRAWEFLAGAMLAVIPQLSRSSRRAAEPLAWAGIAAIVLACVVYSDGTRFPGWAALLPVLGAAAAISAEGRSLGAAGRLAPVAWLGAVSYAVYLWHWPLVILLPQALGHPLGTADKVLVLVVTALLAHASTRFVEEPVRFSPRLLGGRRAPATVLLVCGVAMGVVLVTTVQATHRLDARERQEEATTAQILDDGARCLGAQSVDPKLVPCENPELDGVLVPTPATAVEDDPNRSDCWGTDDGEARVCTLADPPGATRHLLAIGDSHNNALLEAYAMIGEEHGWRIDASGERSCYLTTAEQPAATADLTRECRDWVRSVTARANAGDIDGIIVTHLSRTKLVRAEGRTDEETAVDGLVEAWRRLPDVPIVAIRDNPTMDRQIVSCVEEHGEDAADACAHPREDAVRDDGQAAAAAQVSRARVVDLTDLYCSDVCPPVIGHVLVYRDRSHITRTWARTLAPYLGRGIEAALRR